MNFELPDFVSATLIVIIIRSFQVFYLPTTNKEWKSLFSPKIVPLLVVYFCVIVILRGTYDTDGR